HQRVADLPSLVGTPRLQACELLLTGLLVGLSLGRDPQIQGDAHHLPPGWPVLTEAGRPSEQCGVAHPERSTPTAAGTLGSSGAARRNRGVSGDAGASGDA